MQLREQWTHVQSYSHQLDIGIVAMLGLGAVWFWRSRRR